MTAPAARSGRVAVVGASSLRGKELKQLLAGSILPPAEIRLFDDPASAGLLTEAGDEPAVVQVLERDSFENVEVVFFASSPAFTAAHWADARRAGATVIDLSGALEAQAAVPWIPALDRALAPARPAKGGVFRSPSAASILTTTVTAALAALPVARLAVVLFQPVSERGQAGIDELENQTVHLLSLQPVEQKLYDAQVAFNLLGRYGLASAEQLNELREAVAAEVLDYLAGRVTAPALQLVQAPVFYGYAFTAFVELGAAAQAADIERALAAAGLLVATGEEPGPSNVTAAGQGSILIGAVEPDASVSGAFWIWGAADNIRLAAENAVNIAERLRAS